MSTKQNAHKQLNTKRGVNPPLEKTPLFKEKVGAVAIGSRMPTWASNLINSNSDYVPTFQELRNTYIYLRSIRELISKSDYPTFIGKTILNQLDYVFTKQGFASILDVKEITHSLIKIGLGPDQTLEHKKILLHIKPPEEEILDSKLKKRLTDYLTNGNKLSRSIEWKWRLQTAVHTAVIENGWYPLFGTYTVDPAVLATTYITPSLDLKGGASRPGFPSRGNGGPKGLGAKPPPARDNTRQTCLTRDDLWKKTPAWDRFIKKYKTEIADSLGYGRKPSKWPATATFFQYFAVLEHGKSLEHPHIHVIFLCKNIPQKWKEDPNINDPLNTQFDIPGASSLWPHGRQKITCAIFITGSPFIDKHKWKIPRKYNKKKDKLIPVKVGDAGAIAGYISKYMQKGGKQWNHRVKATKNLGMTQLFKTLSQLKCVPILQALAERPNSFRTAFTLQMYSPCPMSLLRRNSKMELERRWHSSLTELGEQSLNRIWTKKPSGFYTTLIRCVSNGLRLWTMTPEQRYSQYTRIMGASKSTAHSKQIIEDLIIWLDRTLKPMVTSVPYTRLTPRET